MLKRCTRFFIHAPHELWIWHRQKWPTAILIRSDTDRAGCPVTRKSTSGTTASFGRHLWWCSSTTQVPIALSSGEAETYGLVKACSRALGFKNLAQDLGFGRHGEELAFDVATDSSAAIGIAERRGAGKIRHIEAGALWVQSALRNQRIRRLYKIKGTENPSNMLTKAVTPAEVVNECQRLNLCMSTERSAALPEAIAAERAARR